MDECKKKCSFLRKKSKARTILLTILGVVMIAVTMCFNVFLASCGAYTAKGSFEVPILDAVDDLGGTRGDVERGENYLAHPDLVESDDGTIWCMYPEGHGRGPVITKKSTDFGKTWVDYTANTPESWKNSQETPILYNLHFVDDNGVENGLSTLLMTSGNPAWTLEEGQYIEPNGFNYSLSVDDGASWSEFTTLYDKKWAAATNKEVFDCIVAMASLTQLKEDGKFVNKWMGLFHDHNYVNYKTILTFEENADGSLKTDADGRYIANWSEPTPVFSQYQEIEHRYGFCEVEVIREPSTDGKTLSGDRLVAIARCNLKKSYSYMLVSTDEGQTWQTPKQLPIELCGDRHKAEYDPISQRFVISFRQLCVYKVAEAYTDSPTWTSIGWVGWVGSFEQLINGEHGDAVIVLGPTKDTDNGYAGTVYRDGEFLMVGYGAFSKDHPHAYIMSTKFRIDDIEKR